MIIVCALIWRNFQNEFTEKNWKDISKSYSESKRI